jgi:hypothetical protein
MSDWQHSLRRVRGGVPCLYIEASCLRISGVSAWPCTVTDHRFVKRVTKPKQGFKSFKTTSAVLVGIELMHMIRKSQMSTGKGMGLSFAKQFYALAA